MDLANLNLAAHADSGADMEVIHPVTGEKLLDSNEKVVTISLLGTDSTKMRKEMSDRARVQLAKRKPDQIRTVEEVEKTSAELLATLTTGWSGLSENGVPIEYSYENAVMLYLKYPWLRKQVDDFTSDRANFYKA